MRMTIMVAVTCTLASLAFADSSQAAIRQYDLNIPRQTLDTALKDLAVQTGLQIGRMSDTVNGGVMVGPVNGNLTTEQALKTLLKELRLTFKTVNDQTIAIIPMSTDVPERTHSDKGKATSGTKEAQKTSGFWGQFRIAQVDQRSAAGSAAVGGSETATREKLEGLEEIIVTARRREENLQTVPISITALSQQTLNDNNIQTINQLQYLVPSMSATSSYTRDSINLSIRGQKAPPASSVQAVVAYLNEVPIPTTIGGDVPSGPGLFFDLQNVQILNRLLKIGLSLSVR